MSSRIWSSEARSAIQPIRADADTIARHVARLDDLLHRDVARANAFFRTHVAPISCRSVKEVGRKFHRATVAANGSEIVKDAHLRGRFDLEALRVLAIHRGRLTLPSRWISSDSFESIPTTCEMWESGGK
jgi:hypothetical protein